MKKSLIELLTIYFYENGYLSLPKLGRFEVSGETDLSQPEKNDFTRIPADVIQFTYNTKEDTDTELVKYITAHSRKMQALALADLFSFTEQAVQMLNIRQAVSFPGIGTIGRNSKGEMEYTPGEYLSGLLKGEQTNSSYGIQYSEVPSHTNSPSHRVQEESSRSISGMLIILVCIVIAAVLVYFILSNKNQEDTGGNHEQKTLVEDSAKVEKEKPMPTEDLSEWSRTPNKKHGIIHYLVVFEHGVDSSRALKKYRQLKGWGHQVVVQTKDSVHYDVAIPATTKVSDTTKMKDSIYILYGHPTTIRYKTGG